MKLTTVNSKRNIVIEILEQTGLWSALLPDVHALCRKTCEAALEASGFLAHFPEVEISIMLCDDATIQDLNHQFRAKHKPTNVLSFPSNSIDPFDFKGFVPDIPILPLPLGDIILSIETIQKEAELQGKALEHHVQHMLVHGSLHLLGLDHKTDEDQAHMEPLEISILHQLGVENPYKMLDS